jgi:hypothetical protein
MTTATTTLAAKITEMRTPAPTSGPTPNAATP